jgi:phosphoribosyl-ATP pyrophosphohydrolase/phosphoribosyl-AMP cyclohydrolase
MKNGQLAGYQSADLPTYQPADLHWDDRGLVPAVVQDARTGAVLMMAWMNEEALRLTLETGETHFWSRSRGELWHKGATSGNTQRVTGLWADCDGDTLLVQVEPTGPACHTGAVSCFYREFRDVRGFANAVAHHRGA